MEDFYDSYEQNEKPNGREYDVEYEKLKKIGFKEQLQLLDKQDHYLLHPKHQEAVKTGKQKGEPLGQLEALIE